MLTYRTPLRSALLLLAAVSTLVTALFVNAAGPARADGVNPCSKADEHALADAEFVGHHCPGLYYVDHLFQAGGSGVYSDVPQVEYCIKGSNYATGDQLLTVRAAGIPLDPSLNTGDAEIVNVSADTGAQWSATVTFEVPPGGGAIWFRVYCY